MSHDLKTRIAALESKLAGTAKIAEGAEDEEKKEIMASIRKLEAVLEDDKCEGCNAEDETEEEKIASEIKRLSKELEEPTEACKGEDEEEVVEEGKKAEDDEEEVVEEGKKAEAEGEEVVEEKKAKLAARLVKLAEDMLEDDDGIEAEDDEEEKVETASELVPGVEDTIKPPFHSVKDEFAPSAPGVAPIDTVRKTAARLNEASERLDKVAAYCEKNGQVKLAYRIDRLADMIDARKSQLLSK